MERDISEVVAEIRYHHRNRLFAMETRKAMDLRLGWFLRTALGWSKALPVVERKAIASRADTFVKTAAALAKGKDIERPEGFAEFEPILMPALSARAPFDGIEKTAEKEMARLAKELSVWSWAADVRGFGAVGLAIIIAEAGDLSGYPTVAKLWKRMGVGLVNGVRQGGLSKSAKASEWIEHGYSRQRRSRLWNIGDALVKGNGDGEYRTLYLERKDYERTKAEAAGLIVAPAAKIPKGRKDEFMSDMHVHRRAQRVMEKRLLRNLWRAWRETKGAVMPTGNVSPADLSDAA